MTTFYKIAATAACVVVICGSAILWPLYKEKALQRKLALTAKEFGVRAEQGDPKAQFDLAFMYYQNGGVAQDYAQAFRWCRKSAEQGYAKAQSALASMYYQGKGVARDYTEAVLWYRKAAEQGDAKAQFGLAISYAQGQGVPQDDAEAVRWYSKAAEQGYAMAQYGLGNRYRKGEGVPQDYAEAVHWYRKAADQGDVKAQYALGFMYYKGEGVPQDDTEAVRWYLQAAEQGDTDAKNALGIMSRGKSRGVPLAGWASVVLILLALLVAAVPRSRSGRAAWMPWALGSALGTVMLAHELLLSDLSVAQLAQGPLGILWRGIGRAFMIAVLVGGAAICALKAVVEAKRGSRRRGDRPTTGSVGGDPGTRA
jgi:TPR repeat protein